MRPLAPLLGLLAAGLLGLLLLAGTVYTIDETEQVVITQFGKPIGAARTNAGLHFKLPFIHEVNRLEKRVLRWDGRPSEMPTKDKTYIVVDAFGRWRIRDPQQYFLRLRDERSAQSRLDDILGSEIRNAIARHELIELIRSTRDRVPALDSSLAGSTNDPATGRLYPIRKGRPLVEEEILTNAAPKVAVFGVELLDVQFKRVNYNPSVAQRIYERMISERQQIAERFRSEGAGEAAKIAGQKQKDLQTIESEAYRRVQEIRGAADARATEIYAAAYNRSPDTVAFYRFLRTLEAYKTVLTNETTLILTTEGDFFRLLKHPAAP